MDFVKELASEYEREAANTLKMLVAIPEGADWNYKPQAKSMTLGRLADHLTDMTGAWALNILTKDKVEVPVDYRWPHADVTSKAELVERFRKGVPAVAAAIRALSPEQWEQPWQFVWGSHAILGGQRWPIFRGAVVSHMIHHRAQLSVYLRLLDAPIPGMYGPSADDQKK